MAPYDECIIYLLAKAYQKAHGHFKKRLQAHGLTPIQHLIVEALWLEEGVPAGELGKRLTLDSATLSGVLDRMADNGWVVKNQDLEDKRITRVFLSERARDLHPVLAGERRAANEEILAALTQEERILLRRLLKDVQG
ncbi:MAG: MarR family transcriptional regulator [Pseudomonadota bacterium]